MPKGLQKPILENKPTLKEESENDEDEIIPQESNSTSIDKSSKKRMRTIKASVIVSPSVLEDKLYLQYKIPASSNPKELRNWLDLHPEVHHLESYFLIRIKRERQFIDAYWNLINR